MIRSTDSFAPASVCVCSDVENVMDSKLECTDEDGSVMESELHHLEYTANQINRELGDKTEENPEELNQQTHSTHKTSRTTSTSDSCQVEKKQPSPLSSLVPSNKQNNTVLEFKQSLTSMTRSKESIKAEAEQEDLCAGVLLACLFCHPLDCILVTWRGCGQCLWSVCSYLCGCQRATLLDVVHHCDLCHCLSCRCLLGDCPLCELCLHATECLDLAMEISQMLFH